MGKAARKKNNKKKQFYKDPKVQETETPVSKELLYGLDSADPRIRISTSGAISALFGDVQSDLQFTEDMNNQYKANLDMILNSQLLKKIIGRATDNEYLVCMNILGALRNMCIVGGESFIGKICEMNVILPLKNLLYKYVDSLSKGNENDQLITCNLYYQLFSLLTIIFDYDCSGFYELESNGSQSMFDVLLLLLSYSPSENKKLSSLALMMQISIYEFISVIQDQIDSNTAFFQQIMQIADSKEWSIQYRLISLCLSKLSVDQKIHLISSILHTLHTLSIPSLLQSLSQCYSRFNELEQQATTGPEEKEDVIDDTEATLKMDEEALDGNHKDVQSELVTEGEFYQQQLIDIRVLFDILTHVLMDDSLPLSESILQSLLQFIQGVSSFIDETKGIEKQVESVKHQLISGIIELEGALIPYLKDSQVLLSIWTSLIKYCSISAEVASSVIKSIWTWSEMVCQQQNYNDSMNPVCFAEQIGPILNLLSLIHGEELSQLINMFSNLLQPVTINDSNRECIMQVCNTVVHVLDDVNNSSNPEVVGNVIDFMMTIFGNEKFVPIFQALQLNQYVYDATNALQSALSKNDLDLDDDCVDFLTETLNNAVRFIDWIQGGMK